jgi:hypothetical protein
VLHIDAVYLKDQLGFRYRIYHNRSCFSLITLMWLRKNTNAFALMPMWAQRS